MAKRISTQQLARAAERAAESVGLPASDVWIEHTSGIGWGVYRRFGSSRQLISEALTAREAYQLLRGIEVGADGLR